MFIPNAFAISGQMPIKDLTSENRLIINKNINVSGKKTIYFQNGQMIGKNQIDRKKVYCSLENIRDKVAPINLAQGTSFKFDNNDFVRSENYSSIRVWKKSWLFGWENGDVQVFTCDDTQTFFETGVTNVITIAKFKKAVGAFMDIQ